MKAFIVGACEGFAEDKFRPQKGDLVIAADGGFEKIKDKELIDVALGDFDSLGYVPCAKELIKLKVEKDETDSDSAAQYALSKGADEIIFFSCLGGLIDHTVANLQLATRLARQGIKVRFENEGYTVYVIGPGTLDLGARSSGRVSVLSPDISEGVTIKGLKYTVTNHTLVNTCALGVSNEFIGQAASVSLKKGVLWIFTYEKSGDIRS